MSKIEFSYSTRVKGEKMRLSLPFDPLSLGFTFKKKIDCCLFFESETHALQVKAVSHIVIVRPLEKNRVIPLESPTFASHAHFKKELKNAGII